MSLRDQMREKGGPFERSDALKVLEDIATALLDLDKKAIVHRDLKPENILLIDRSWCLADFGISRYAEATTASDTRKYALSPEYAAPERWRGQRAATATDVYSWGVIAYELLSGSHPFKGPGIDDLREQHLHQRPAAIANPSVPLDALVSECLYKSPQARPTPSALLLRLERLNEKKMPGAGLVRLQEAHLAEAARRGELQRRESELQSLAEQRSGLLADAKVGLDRIAKALKESVVRAAPSSVLRDDQRGGWSLRLSDSELQISAAAAVAQNPWGSAWESPKFNVIASAVIGIRIPADREQYEGRSHALWYCDAQEKGSYGWFETAFMVSPLIPRRVLQNPFALGPSEDSAKALGPGLTEFQVAWPFTSITIDMIDEFINRWASWFADASQGKLMHPRSMPERHADGSWRRS